MLVVEKMNCIEGKSILVVDDEPDLREIIIDIFMSQGAHVKEAKNGREAWELFFQFAQHSIDLVVSDMKMPHLSGRELLKKLQSLQPQVPPFLLVSGQAEITLEEIYGEGGSGILTKPFALDLLVETAKKLLTPRSLRWKALNSGEKPLPFFTLDSSEHSTVHFGLSGFFMNTPHDLPLVNQKIAFKVIFDQCSHFEGEGICRWTRRATSRNLPRGAGVEFTYLPEEAYQFWSQKVSAEKIHCEIPRS